MRSTITLPGLCILPLTGCDVGTPTDSAAQTPIARITVVSGDSQFGRTGETLADPVVVRVSGRSGEPIASAEVAFTIASGGGVLSLASAETDHGGLARTDWTLGAGPEHRLRVSPANTGSAADPVDVFATNELVLTIEVVSGGGQVAFRGDVLPDPVVVSLEDCYGEVSSGIHIEFEVIRGGGRVVDANVTSNEVGMAEASWALGRGPDNRLQATVVDDSFTAVPAVLRARTELELALSWISDVPFYDHNGQPVEHDNRILESNHFLVFSDADSDSSKTRMATLTERYLAELLQDLEVDTATQIGIEPADRKSKITVYSMLEFREHGQIAFPYGFFHAGFDSAPYLEWGIHNVRFFNSIKHETVHVVNMLMNGASGQPFWFTEGIAEYASGGGEPSFETWAEVEEWMSVEEHANPISIRTLQDLPVPDSWGEYYPMFHLAVEYLLSEGGLGRSLVDVKYMWTDMAAGQPFDTVFQTALGITVNAFETSFYGRMWQYLNR